MLKSRKAYAYNDVYINQCGKLQFFIYSITTRKRRIIMHDQRIELEGKKVVVDEEHFNALVALILHSPYSLRKIESCLKRLKECGVR